MTGGRAAPRGTGIVTAPPPGGRRESDRRLCPGIEIEKPAAASEVRRISLPRGPELDVCRQLNQAGFRAFFVGGAVRGGASGIRTADADLTTDARPEQIHALAARNGIKTSLRGAALGGVKLFAGSLPVVVTTFRRESWAAGKTSVVFTSSLREDAVRRDFTVNAIYADCDGELTDPLDGMADLDDRIVRFIGSPDQRIREDVVRILRYFRIRAAFADPGVSADARTLDAIARHAARLGEIPRERIGKEMLKLLSAETVGVVLEDMRRCGALERILANAEVSRIRKLEAAERACGAAPDALRRIAVLCGRDPGGSLRLDRRSARRLARIRWWADSKAGDHELAYRLGESEALDVLLTRAAVSGDPPERRALERLERAGRARLPVRAADLNAVRHGRELGEALRRLERIWLDSECRMSRSELLALADR